MSTKSIILGLEHVIYQKLANFIYKKDTHLNRLESVIFSMYICILQNKTKCQGGTEQCFPYSLHQKSVPQMSNLALKKALNFQNHSSSGSLNPVKKFLPVKFPIFSYWSGGNLPSPLKSR